MHKLLETLRIFVCCLLFGIFLHLFGKPALERYRKQSVLVESKVIKHEDLLNSPGVAVCVDPSTYPEFVSAISNIQLEDICKHPTQTIDCLENRLHNFSQMIYGSTWSTQYLTMIQWESFMSSPMYGKCFSVGKDLKLGKIKAETSAFIKLNTSLRYNIFIHDPKYFFLSANPVSIPQISKTLGLPKDEKVMTDVQYIAVTKHIKKDRKDDRNKGGKE